MMMIAGTTIAARQVRHSTLKSPRLSWSMFIPMLNSLQDRVAALQYEEITNMPNARTLIKAGNQLPPLFCAACTCGMKGCRVNESPTFIRIHTTNGTSRPLIDHCTNQALRCPRLAPGESRQCSAIVPATSAKLITELKMKTPRHIQAECAPSCL